MDNSVKDRILVEMEQIEQLLAAYSDLLTKAHIHPPNLTEIAAIGSVLHSFYTGVENIFLRVAKDIDQSVPSEANWHRTLLKTMSAPAPYRSALISKAVAERLARYLSFRHFYRHAYTFFLDWTQLRELVLDMNDVWNDFRQEVTAFLSTDPGSS